MRIISKKILKKFCQKYNDSEDYIRHWYKKVENAQWSNSADVKKTFQSVDQPIINNRLVAIFNVGWNRYRIITVIHFQSKIVYIRDVLTHEEYNKRKWMDKI